MYVSRRRGSIGILKAHLQLRFVSVVLPFLHGGGHLIHGGDDGTAGLTKTFWTTLTKSAINLGWKRQMSTS